MIEEYKISDDVKKALRITKIITTKEGNKVFIFQLGCFDAFLRFFLVWIFTIGNILIAMGEIIAMAMDSFPKEIWWAPIIHILLLLFPFFMLKDLPPKGMEINSDSLKLAYRKIFNGMKYKDINLSKIDYLKSYFTSYKGTLRTEIRGVMNSGRSKLIFKSRISEEAEHKIVSGFFSELLNKEIKE
ncbi:MAG: hypothetical protein K9J13_17090 [Saprospiraceae bacterium]|nr:hypothetical protein [Saprospiraceae bacterium]